MLKLTKYISRILNLIEREGLHKTTDLAKRLKMSPAGVHKQLKRLKEAGVLKEGYEIDYTPFGHIQIMLLLELYRPLDTRFISSFRGIPEVKAVSAAEGDFDIVIHAVFPDERKMRHFLNTLLTYNEKIKEHKIVMLRK